MLVTIHIKKGSEMIIDIHTHIFPDKIADKVLENTDRSLGLNSKSGGMLTDLKNQMEVAGVDVAFVLAVSPNADLVVKTNDWLLGVQDEKVKFLGTIHPDLSGWESELSRLKTAGVLGIKFNALLQQIRPDDVRMFSIYEKMAELDMVALFHSGASYKDRNQLENVLATPQRIAQVNDQFPKLKMIVAHFGGNHMLAEVESHLLGRDVFLDTSYTPDVFELDKNRIARLIRTHGVEKILFGTDFPWETPERGISFIRTLGFTQDEENRILGLNAAQLMLGHNIGK
jgi:predicted TIM-barrel fold metal-dependent hydrolase